MKSIPFPNGSRDAAVLEFLENEHFRFRRNPDAAVEINEIALETGWFCRLEAPITGLTSRMMADFRRFCRECMKIELIETPCDTAGVVWILADDALPTQDFDRQNPEVEQFAIRVSEERVEISARHERGLLHGTHALEWLMADRGGPFLRKGQVTRKPAFQPRISNGVFIEGYQTWQSPGHFPDDYLALMSHYGVNGIHLHTNLWDVFRSATAPELNNADFESHIAALRELNRRTLRFGIDLYLCLNTPPLLETHPVFLAHPEACGSLVEIFAEEVSGRSWYNLCSGSEVVLKAYSEAVEAIFSAAPDTAGAVMIIGGEGFFHCYTRPANAGGGLTNCPRCQDRSASAEIARLVNTVAAAVKKTGAHKALYAWPYSAWIWSAEDPFELNWIAQLDPTVSVLSNFDGYDEDTRTNAGVRFFDYNISCIGPSQTFTRQAEACRKAGKAVFAKVESCTTPEAFFLPYLPVHQRWLDRAEAMKASGVAGFIGQWRFFGMNGSPPEELQYRATWQNNTKDALVSIARRDFALEAHAAAEAAAAWRELSAAWDHFPYSAMTCGERTAYMRGPFYLGPAHPLIFDVQESYNLPASFRLLRGDVKEMVTAEEFEELQRLAKPRYVSDLLVVLPFGVDRYLELLEKCRGKWRAGMIHLRRTLEKRGPRAELELGVVETIDSHLRSLENVVRFYRARDVLQNSTGGPAEFQERLDVLLDILDDEITNAERMVPLLERDPRLGYGYCYGPVYDAEMVRAKITQCKYVRHVELPRFSQVIRFHIWLQTP